jgi:aspartate kinase
MIVMKFGGSSVESASAITRVASIVRSHLEQQPVVVVSAMGKTTDRLLEIASLAVCNETRLLWKKLDELQYFHFQEAERLLLPGVPLQELQDALRDNFSSLRLTLTDMVATGCGLTPLLKDEIASYGERLSSQIVAAALNGVGIRSTHLDCRKVIVTDGEHTRATPLFPEINARVRRYIFAADGVVVMGGFIGATEAGVTTTLGRGGSDFTASIVGAAIDAREIQIWTDVDGMLTCDPRVLPHGCRIKAISYAEAAEMARWGAKVLHPDTVMPAIKDAIPVVIRNSRRPQLEGTRILAHPARCKNPVKGIACMSDISLLEIRTPQGMSTSEFLQPWTKTGAHPAIELVSSVREMLYVGVKTSEQHFDLGISLDSSEVSVRHERAVVSLVGEAIARTSRVLKRACAALNEMEAIVLRPDCSPNTISIVVPQRDLHRAVELLHAEFFQQLDSSVFADFSECNVLASQQRTELAPLVAQMGV